ncbi:hypothetical protein VNO80_17653 [Phaseolus coccineus]|uniref:Uncharacterized protein n=1 Tax=Phaseolus coccineus TaxID=3886 RepID=A0AAN9QYP6_PHACN
MKQFFFGFLFLREEKGKHRVIPGFLPSFLSETNLEDPDEVINVAFFTQRLSIFTKRESNGPESPGGCRPTNHSTVFEYRNGCD